MLRLAHPLSSCHTGLATYVEQPLPAPFHTDSDQPRVVDARLSEVPPTAMTLAAEAGHDVPYPSSPVEAVIAIPGWTKYLAFADASALLSGPPQLLVIAFTPGWVAA